MMYKDIPFIKKEDSSKHEQSTSSNIKASNVFTSLLSDDNVTASNRSEQPVNTKGGTGDFTNFDAVDYEIEKHIVTYSI